MEILLNKKISGVLFAIGLFCVAGSVHAATVMTPPTNDIGLVGHWTFDGKDMYRKVADTSGYGNNGDLQGQTATSSVLGKIGQALHFDGVNDYVDAGNPSSLQITSNLTVSAWIKLDSQPVGGGYIIVGKDNSAGGRAYTFDYNTSACVSTAPCLRFYINGGSSSGIVTGGGSDQAQTGQWAHVVGTYTPDGTLTLYKNGVQIGQVTGADTSIPNATAHVDIGRREYPGFQEYFPGSIDDVRIYNRTLSATEIASLYKAGSAKFLNSTSLTNGSSLQNGLIGHWTFDGKNMTRNVADSSGNGNTGYILGQTSTTSVQGRIGQALKLDGTNDEVNIQATNIGATSVSVAAWVYILGFTEGTFGGGDLGAIIFDTRTAGEVSPTLFTTPHDCGSGPQQGLTFLADTNGIAKGAKGTTNLSTGRWYFVVGTFAYDAAVSNYGGNWDVYLNGVKDNPSTNNCALGGGLPGPADFTGTTWHLGTGPQWAGYSNVILDDVRVYNRVLSQSEITQLYNLGAQKLNVTPVAPASGGIDGGLVGHWTFDGKDMYQNVADSSGAGNTGYLMNFTSTTTVQGKIGQALRFNGSNQYVVDKNLVNTTVTTVSAWVKIPAIPSSAGMIAGFAGGEGSGTYDKDLYINTDGKLYFYVFDSGQKATSAPSAALPLNTWVHVVGTADGANAYTYVNGVQAGSVSAGATYAGYSGADIFINGSTLTFSHLPASIDDVRVYNRALSASEVQQLYNMGR